MAATAVQSSIPNAFQVHEGANQDRPNELVKKVVEAAKNAFKGIPQTVSTISIEMHAFMTLWKQIDFREVRIRNFLQAMDDRNLKIEAMQTLQQQLRVKRDGVDFSQDEEMKELLNQCRSFGVVIEENKTAFNKDEIEALLANLDTVINRHMSQNDKSKMELSMDTSQREMLITLLTNILKKMEEGENAVVRNIGRS